MKYVKIFTIVLFFMILLIPMLLFNFKSNQVSEIDNRKLIENPFTLGRENFLSNVTSYLEDRIGFRNEMIYAYTIANDKLFGEMVHPTYTYGKDGYVFGKMGKNQKFGDYGIIFSDFIEKTQSYCISRNIPFVFVFTPSKISVVQDKLPTGCNFDNSWISNFFNELDKRNVRYVDNLSKMVELYKSGEMVFNKKYNAGHWNDLGAFYGVNNILEEIQKDFPALHINTLNEFDINYQLRTTLQVSQFPIIDYEPVFTGPEVCSVTDNYRDELKINNQFRSFGYYINDERLNKNGPRILVFQGSYMNGMGYKFFKNACGEYIYVHDYQNIIDMDYYINIFQPDCVIFEAAEYTLNDSYFDSSKMKEKQFNPSVNDLSNIEEISLDRSNYILNSGKSITEITVHISSEAKYYYIKIGDKIFDLIPNKNNELCASIKNSEFEENNIVLLLGY